MHGCSLIMTGRWTGVAGHLRSAADVVDSDEWRTSLAIGVLGVLGRGGARGVSASLYALRVHSDRPGRPPSSQSATA